MIGILDSGIGGLPAARRLTERLPGADILYFGDSARAPYGGKDPETILRCAREGLQVLLDLGAGMIVISCHTLSACARHHLSDSTEVPVIDIISPTALAARRLTRNGKVGVIGPAALADAGAYESEFRTWMPEATVWTSSCPLLEPLVEEGRLKKPETIMIVKKYLLPLKRRHIDTLIPGCGHYVPLYPVIRKKIGNRVRLVDPVDALVGRIEAAVGKLPEPTRGEENGRIRFLLTDTPPWLQSAARRLFRSNIELERISWSGSRPRIDQAGDT